MRILLLAAVLFLAPRPTPTPNYPATMTALAVQLTATPTSTPTASPSPSPSPTPAPPPPSGPGGTAGSPCAKGDFGIGISLPIIGQETICIPLSSLLGSIFQALAGLFTGALGTVIGPFNAILTLTPNMTTWPDARAVWNNLWGVGVAMYGTFIVFAALHHYRRLVWAGQSSDPLLALSDAVVGAMLIGGLPWIIDTWIGLVNDLASTINGYVGPMGLGALQKLFTDALSLLTGDPLLIVVDVILGILMLVFMLVVGLIRLVGLYAELWLYLIAPFAVACWVYPPTRDMAGRWARAFVSITLWGSGFALALKAIALMALDLATSDPAYGNPLVEAVTAVAGMIFLFGVPRFVDAMVGTSVAAASGSYVMAQGVVAATASAIGRKK